jgi:glycosyltransferase involved in cell wall biosynthesis
VYNDGKYLTECIESVLAQKYSNWDYTIVDNCSTDNSCAIAQKYASKDQRIKLVNTDWFLPIIENHNRTIRQISPRSKYCKFLFADDWLYPSCIEEMVRMAERYPSVGLVSAYGTDGHTVLWTGVSCKTHELRPPYQYEVVPGAVAARAKLMGGPYVFGSMTSLLIRSDLVRKRQNLFNEQNLHADHEACFDLLQESDFGFVHQVLTFTRPRDNSQGAFARDFNSLKLGEYVILRKYGPVYLDSAEYRKRLEDYRREYYRSLATNVLRLRTEDFWKYHRDTLAAFGDKIDRWLLTRLAFALLGENFCRPLRAAANARRWWSLALRRNLMTRGETKI